MFVPARRFVSQQGLMLVEDSTSSATSTAQDTPGDSGARKVPTFHYIDDLSEPWTNLAVSIPCKVTIDGLGVIVSSALAWARAIDVESMTVRVVLSDGVVMEGPIHPSWTLELLALVQALEDLVKAYRQVPGRPSQAWVNVVAAWHASKCVVDFSNNNSASRLAPQRQFLTSIALVELCGRFCDGGYG